MNDQIAALYDRLGKPKGAVFYRDIAPVTWINSSEIEAAQVPWYRGMFEGDGTSSWYEFMIPQTRSVVSMDDDINASAKVSPVTSKETSWYDFLIPSF